MTFSSFKPKHPPRPATQWDGPTPSPRAPALRKDDGKASMVIPLPKDRPRRSEAFRRYVSTLPCQHCERPGPSQCAHGDFGKGMAIKAGDDTSFPLCADSPGRRGCHTLIGSTGAFTQEQRRGLELYYGMRTRVQAIKDGKWPEGWPV